MCNIFLVLYYSNYKLWHLLELPYKSDSYGMKQNKVKWNDIENI